MEDCNPQQQQARDKKASKKSEVEEEKILYLGEHHSGRKRLSGIR